MPATSLLVLLFFVSGATGLIYEVVWSRSLQTVLGVSTFAITVVVAAYMGGLALGSAWFGRIADRRGPGRAFVLYGVLELAIGLFAFAFGPLLGGMGAVHGWLAAVLGEWRLVRLAAELLLAFLLLLIPTTLMGGTLPLIVRGLAARVPAGRAFGTAYAMNTLGAVAGTLLSAFVLLEAFGMRGTLALVGGSNLALGVTVVGRRRAAGAETERAAPGASAVAPPPRPGGGRWLLVAGLSGFLALSCEILWVRGFASLFLSTTYTFALVLACFLIGIALGAALGSRLQATPGRLAALMLVLSAAALAQIALYATIHQDVLRRMVDSAQALARSKPGLGLAGFGRVSASWTSAVVLPLTLASGAVLPLVVKLRARAAGHAGRETGAVYVANTIGAVTGCVVAGFVLIPALGAIDGCRALALGGALGTAVLCPPGRGFAWLGAAVVAALALALPGPSTLRQSFSPVHLGAGWQVMASGQRDTLAAWEPDFLQVPLVLEHGLATDAAILLDLLHGDRSLVLNGMPNGSAGHDRKTEYLIATLPWLFAPRLDRSLHVGLGTGITAGAYAALPGVGATTIVELERELFDLSRHFAPWSFDLHARRDVRFVAEDGRAWLALAPRHGFDVILSQPSQLWAKGMGSLFTAEFFAEVRERLAPDGVFACWIMGYGVAGDTFAIAVQTLLDAFPHVLACMCPDRVGDVVFLASGAPLAVRPDRLRELLALPPPAALIRTTLGLRDPADLLLHVLVDEQRLWPLISGQLHGAGAAELRNTDDRPILEHRYPRHLFEAAHNGVIEQLQRARYQAGPGNGPGAFFAPAGLDAEALRPQAYVELCALSGVDPLPLRCGLGSFAELEARLPQMSALQRELAFVHAVRMGESAAAMRLWSTLRGAPLTDPDVAQAALALGHQQSSTVREDAIGRLSRPLASLEVETLRMLLDHHSAGGLFANTFQARGASAEYCQTMLAGLPTERFLEVFLPFPYFQNLVRAASVSGRLAEAETWLRAARATHGDGLHFGIDLALRDLCREQGREAEVRALELRYRGFTAAEHVFAAPRVP